MFISSILSTEFYNSGTQAMLRRSVIRFTFGFIVLTLSNFAQAQDDFSARLNWVPIGGAERNDVSGSGSATATVSNSQLSISGSFENLPAAATFARLHQGIVTGVRGPAIAELQISKNSQGTFTGDISLSQEQMESLQSGHLYIQLHAERGVAPDNAVLWGWIIDRRFLNN
jgi:hypothetical protein